MKLTTPVLPAETPVYVDRPTSKGRHRYTVTSVAEDGWESPSSHSVDIVTGGEAEGPRIMVSRPVDILRADEAVEIRAVVCGDAPAADVTLHWRTNPADAWLNEPMPRRFRCSHHAMIVPPRHSAGFLEYYIEATDVTGLKSYWPPTAPDGRAWTATVISP